MLRCPIVGIDFGHSQFKNEHLKLEQYNGLRVFVDRSRRCHRIERPDSEGVVEQTAFELDCDLNSLQLLFRDTKCGSFFGESKVVLFECFNLNGNTLGMEFGRHDVSGWRWTATGFEAIEQHDRHEFQSRNHSETFLFSGFDFNSHEALAVNFWVNRESHCMVGIIDQQYVSYSGVSFIAGL